MAVFNKSIDILNLDEGILTILKGNGILFIKDLWILKRSDLKRMGLGDYQINQVIIKLELEGLDLNKKLNSK